MEATAEGVAFAIAESFAEVSTYCSAEGNAEARAEGYALAEARASAIAEGIAAIFVTTDVCGNCTSVIDAFVSVSKEIVVEAVAEAWTEVRRRRRTFVFNATTTPKNMSCSMWSGLTRLPNTCHRRRVRRFTSSLTRAPRRWTTSPS